MEQIHNRNEQAKKAAEEAAIKDRIKNLAAEVKELQQIKLESYNRVHPTNKVARFEDIPGGRQSNMQLSSTSTVDQQDL